MVGAIFVYAYKQDIIPKNPLPQSFRGSFDKGENRKTITESDQMRIKNLDDTTLPLTRKVAKYCMVFQIQTGIDYCDIATLYDEHFNYDEKEQQWLIRKPRQKNGKIFRVPLSIQAGYTLDKLKELSGENGELPLRLPSISYTLRQYKNLATNAGVRLNIGTKTCRHTFAINHMDNNGALEELQAMLGHSDISTTGIYGKITDKRLLENMKKLEQKCKIHQ